MASDKAPEITERESLKVAEASRQAEWDNPSFMRELFLGRFRLDLVYPFPLAAEWRPEFTAFYERFRAFLRDEVDPAEIDATGEYPEEVVDGLRRLGAFGMKIPVKYGGLGFTNVEYGRAMMLLGSVDGNIAALLSAHQSIGVPQPLKLFGTEELKRKYLPRCAAGEISAFALTELQVGSDPARLATTAEKTARSCGARTARSPSSSWSWPSTPGPARSALSLWRRTGRGSGWSTAAASWACAPSRTR
jgi:alkylation response protein AidB-like acyl-CoA dehydrogenase